MCFWQKYQKNLKIAEYPVYQLKRLGLLEVPIALSNPNNLMSESFAQGYCVAIVSLSLL